MKRSIGGMIAGTVVALGMLAQAAFAAPANPTQNLTPPASGDGIAAINQARAGEGLPPLSLPADYASLSPADQLFVLLNEERIARGLPPAVGLATALDQAAAAGAAGSRDPQPPASLNYVAGGSVWGEASSLGGVVFGWMYDDGWGGSQAATPNLDCTGPTAPGCWGHRDVILGDYGSAPLMGAAVTQLPSGGVSVAAILLETSGPQPALDATWSQISGGTGGTGGTPGTGGSGGTPGTGGSGGTPGTGGTGGTGGSGGTPGTGGSGGTGGTPGTSGTGGSGGTGGTPGTGGTGGTPGTGGSGGPAIPSPGNGGGSGLCQVINCGGSGHGYGYGGGRGRHHRGYGRNAGGSGGLFNGPGHGNGRGNGGGFGGLLGIWGD